MRSPLLLLLLCALGHPLSACGYGCDDIGVPGLVITVIDASTGEHICDAEVVVTHGDYRVSLTERPWWEAGSGDGSAGGSGDGSAGGSGDGSAGGSRECVYWAAMNRPGMYTVTVSKPGYATATRSGLRVTEGRCHVRTLEVTIPLGR